MMEWLAVFGMEGPETPDVMPCPFCGRTGQQMHLFDSEGMEIGEWNILGLDEEDDLYQMEDRQPTAWEVSRWVEKEADGTVCSAMIWCACSATISTPYMKEGRARDVILTAIGLWNARRPLDNSLSLSLQGYDD